MIIGSRPIGKEAISGLSFASENASGGALAEGSALISVGATESADFIASFEFAKAFSLQIASSRREFIAREVLVNKKPSSMYADRISPLSRI